MSEQHTHMIINEGEYQTQIFYTDGPVAPDDEHPTEWMIFQVSDGKQVATGWGPTPRRAREDASGILAKLRERDAIAL